MDSPFRLTAPLAAPSRRAVLVAAVCLVLAEAAPAAETLAGPIAAEVVETIDGDTLRVRAQIWLDQTVEAKVRLRGVDAPESRSSCPDERAAAAQARSLLADLAPPAATVSLRDVAYDKYGGRVLARIVLSDGRDAGDVLLAAGLARIYDGGRKAPWCG